MVKAAVKIVLIFFFIPCNIAWSQSFADFLSRVQSLPDSLKYFVVDSFMNSVPEFPYTEQDSLVHFLYRGNASTINIPGDANYWNAAAFPMTRISGTDLWYRSEIFPPDARLDYKFLLNGSLWILDPLNPKKVAGGYGPNSELRMPLYEPPPEIQYYSGISHGSIYDTLFYSQIMGNSRTIRIYLPPEYSTERDSFPLVLFHDGSDYLSAGSARNILDYLISRGRIKPVIGLFVPPVNRTEEYAGDLKDEFSRFIVQEVLVWVDGKFRTHRNPAGRVTLGASNGGNIALWLGLHYPEVFSGVAGQSSNVEESISTALASGPLLNLTFYLDVGTFDIPILQNRVHSLVNILKQHGYTLDYRIYHEGHSWGNWRAHLDDALEMFFPGTNTSIRGAIESRPAFVLGPANPNPFN
jgi:enterochelin esterase-like enzyme